MGESAKKQKTCPVTKTLFIIVESKAMNPSVVISLEEEPKLKGRQRI
jgi:hypothetical protein